MEWHEQPAESRKTGTGAKQLLIVLSVVFMATLAIVVGKEMSSEAMAVVVGVACGVVAGLPTSMLLLVALTRRDQSRIIQGERARQGNVPPVVIVQGGGGHALAQGPQAGYWPSPMPGPSVERQFQVVGGEGQYLDARR